MSQDTPLSRKIATLVAEDSFDGRALILGPSGSEDTLALILKAVDDTMILRDAVFSVGKSFVTLRISGKRLLWVVDASQDLAPAEGLIDQQLSAETTDALGQVAGLLEQLAAKEGTLTLERRVTESHNKQAGSGVGIQTLSSYFAVTEKTPLTDGMDTFVATCVEHAVAMIEIVDEKMMSVSGDQPEVDNLKAIYGDFWAEFAAQPALQNSTTGEEFLVTVEIPDADGNALVYVKSAEKQYVALVSVTEIAMVATAWGNITSAR